VLFPSNYFNSIPKIKNSKVKFGIIKKRGGVKTTAPQARKKKSAKLAFPQFRQKRNSQNRKIFSPIKRKRKWGRKSKNAKCMECEKKIFLFWLPPSLRGGRKRKS